MAEGLGGEREKQNGELAITLQLFRGNRHSDSRCARIWLRSLVRDALSTTSSRYPASLERTVVHSHGMSFSISLHEKRESGANITTEAPAWCT